MWSFISPQTWWIVTVTIPLHFFQCGRHLVCDYPRIGFVGYPLVNIQKQWKITMCLICLMGKSRISMAMLANCKRLPVVTRPVHPNYWVQFRWISGSTGQFCGAYPKFNRGFKNWQQTMENHILSPFLMGKSTISMAIFNSYESHSFFPEEAQFCTPKVWWQKPSALLLRTWRFIHQVQRKGVRKKIG